MDKKHILNSQINFQACLAPMVGLSHVVLRLIVKSYMPKEAHTIWPTEMLNSRKLPLENVGHTNETFRSPDENFLVPQILGNEEEPIRISLQKLKEWGASGIDINMGCPVQKALKHNYGVALMGDANYAKSVVRMTVQNTDLPVSVKLRAGIQGDFNYLKNFMLGLQDEGVAWLTLHPRTAEQKRRGHADWNQIKEIKKSLSIPVIGNGDVQTAADVIEMIDLTDCNMVMIGRALCARPWLMWQLGEKLSFAAPEGRTGAAPSNAEAEGFEYLQVLKQFVSLSKVYFKESYGLRKLLFFVRTGSVWLDFGHELYAKLSSAQSYDQAIEVITRFETMGLRMSQKTDLRQ